MIRTKKNSNGGGGTITLYSHDGSKELYSTSYKSDENKSSAMKRVKDREKQINYFKHKED